jgi:hypothetical protein
MEHRLNGRWNIVITARMGQQKAVWELKIEGDTITGNIFDEATGKLAGIVESTESLDDDSFSFKTTLKLKFGKLGFTITGKIDSDTEISGEASMRMMGSSKFVGKKQ